MFVELLLGLVTIPRRSCWRLQRHIVGSRSSWIVTLILTMFFGLDIR